MSSDGTRRSRKDSGLWLIGIGTSILVGLLPGLSSAERVLTTPLTKGDQLLFLLDARDARVPFLLVSNPEAEAVTIEIAFYPASLTGRIASQRYNLESEGHVIVDPTSDSVAEGALRGVLGLAVVTPVDAEGAPIVPPSPLTGSFTLANLGLQAAFGENALGRLAVSADGTRAEPGVRVDGSKATYQHLAPGVLAVPTYFNPQSLAPAALDGNRVILGAFRDEYGPRFEARPGSEIVSVTMQDASGAAVAFRHLPLNGILSTTLQDIAGGVSLFERSGKVFFDVRTGTENFFGLFSQSLGQFASGHRMPAVRDVPTALGASPAPTLPPSITPRPSTGPPGVRTLAYVLAACRDGRTITSSLEILRAGQSAIRVPLHSQIELSSFAVSTFPFCYHLSQSRDGASFVHAGGVQRLGVSPDGDLIVFEINNPGIPFLGSHPREERGFYAVRSDGTQFRKLTSAIGDPASMLPPGGATGLRANYLSFDPSGTTVTFPAPGTGPNGESATQIAVMDVTTGEVRTLTQLPGVADSDDFGSTTCCPYFVDHRTITFRSRENPGGLNPEGVIRRFSVDVETQHLQVLPALTGELTMQLGSLFAVTGPGTNVNMLVVPGTPGNPYPNVGLTSIVEMFLRTQKQGLLQLTNFGRSDTNGGTLSLGHDRVFLVASANVGENPSNNCQVFSVSSLGGEVRQLTHFHPGAKSDSGCVPAPFFWGGGSCNTPPGCTVGLPRQEPTSGTLVFDSGCNPFESKLLGNALFAMAPDGSALTEIARARGLYLDEGDRSVVELIGPWAMSAPVF